MDNRWKVPGALSRSQATPTTAALAGVRRPFAPTNCGTRTRSRWPTRASHWSSATRRPNEGESAQAVKDNPRRAPTAQRRSSFSLKTRGAGANSAMPVEARTQDCGGRQVKRTNQFPRPSRPFAEPVVDPGCLCMAPRTADRARLVLVVHCGHVAVARAGRRSQEQKRRTLARRGSATSKQPSRRRSAAERQLSALEPRDRGPAQAEREPTGRALLISSFSTVSRETLDRRPSGTAMPAVR